MTQNRYYDGPPSDHYDGTRFFLPGAAPLDKSRGDLFRFLLGSRYERWPRQVDNPPATPLLQRVAGTGLRVTSIGHATHLIQTAGLNLLVDPVWSKRASPFGFAGPKRVRPPGLALDALPPLDAILVTHNHYDHMDVATLSALRRRHACRLIVPLGNDVILRRADPALAAEAYDWGARVALGDGAIFRDIGARFGPPRLAIIPIGAYEPRWFMRDQHVDPDEAVKIFQDCGAATALAHHWGTFQLTSEAIDAPPQRLAAALATAGIAADRFRVQRPGEAFDVPEIGQSAV